MWYEIFHTDLLEGMCDMRAPMRTRTLRQATLKEYYLEECSKMVVISRYQPNLDDDVPYI